MRLASITGFVLTGAAVFPNGVAVLAAGLDGVGKGDERANLGASLDSGGGHCLALNHWVLQE
jgi:hypothetical protein